MNKYLKESRFLEMRALEEEDEMIIEGYAVVFDSPATHSGYTEIVDKNAFNVCDMRDVSLKYNHENSVLILVYGEKIENTHTTINTAKTTI